MLSSSDVLISFTSGDMFHNIPIAQIEGWYVPATDIDSARWPSKLRQQFFFVFYQIAHNYTSIDSRYEYLQRAILLT